ALLCAGACVDRPPRTERAPRTRRVVGAAADARRGAVNDVPAEVPDEREPRHAPSLTRRPPLSAGTRRRRTARTRRSCTAASTGRPATATRTRGRRAGTATP